MTDDWKDRRLKFIELPRQFEARANVIDITAKQHIRTCHKLAEQLARRKPKTADEFEKVETMKAFVIASSDLNEQTIELLAYLRGVLNVIAADTEGLARDAKIHDQLRDQTATIETLWQTRDKMVNELYELRKTNIASTAN